MRMILIYYFAMSKLLILLQKKILRNKFLAKLEKLEVWLGATAPARGYPKRGDAY